MASETAIGFLIFYVIFLGVVFWFQTQSAIVRINGGLEFSEPVSAIEAFISLFNPVTTVGWINILLLVPAGVVLSWMVIAVIAGIL